MGGCQAGAGNAETGGVGQAGLEGGDSERRGGECVKGRTGGREGETETGEVEKDLSGAGGGRYGPRGRKADRDGVGTDRERGDRSEAARGQQAGSRAGKAGRCWRAEGGGQAGPPPAPRASGDPPGL